MAEPTEEENAIAHGVIEEGVDKAAEFRKMFTTDARGVLVFLYTMKTLFHQFDHLMLYVDDAPEFLSAWISAGRPATILEAIAIFEQRGGGNVH
jgi:hypothetical protein